MTEWREGRGRRVTGGSERERRGGREGGWQAGGTQGTQIHTRRKGRYKIIKSNKKERLKGERRSRA